MDVYSVVTTYRRIAPRMSGRIEDLVDRGRSAPRAEGHFLYSTATSSAITAPFEFDSDSDLDIISYGDDEVDEATAKRHEESRRQASMRFDREAAELDQRLAELSILPADDEDWNDEVDSESEVSVRYASETESNEEALDYEEEVDEEVVTNIEVVELGSSDDESGAEIHEIYVDASIKGEKDFLDSDIVRKVVKIVDGEEEVLTEFELGQDDEVEMRGVCVVGGES